MVVENRSGFKAPEFPQVRSVPGVPQSPRNSSYSLENIGVRHIGRTSLKPGCMSFFFQGVMKGDLLFIAHIMIITSGIRSY